MIALLEHNTTNIAADIYEIFQASYRIEAQLIGTLNFPPLQRTVSDIAQSLTMFYGAKIDSALAGVIEIEYNNKQLSINSLTVSPDFFRRGIAGQLMRHVLTVFEIEHAVVETASVNMPAIELYKKHGFVQFKCWTPSHGIEKVALQRSV